MCKFCAKRKENKLGNINLYKIDKNKQENFFNEINEKFKLSTKSLTKNISYFKDKCEFNCCLYIAENEEKKDLVWNWILNEFEHDEIKVKSQPKAVVIIKNKKYCYAVTYGCSFFTVDKFCDRDFAFNFARKIEFENIKTTTLTSPNSHRNKTVNTYIDYTDLEFDSGESFAKLKVKAKLEDGFSLFKSSLEIGTSIRFSTDEDSIDRILQIILYVEHVLLNSRDKYRIPFFSKIKDKDLINTLNEDLLQTVKENPFQINMAELNIIGVTEIFNNNDSEFILSHKGKRKKVPSLTSDEISTFCTENGFNLGETLLDINVVSMFNGSNVVTKKVRDLIDYTDDRSKCVFTNGIWYRFNEDYLNYLNDSIDEIEALYDPYYDLTKKIYDSYIDKKYLTEAKDIKYNNLSKDQIIQRLKDKYYVERVFNSMRENDGFENHDRRDKKVEKYTLEQMDLYKDGKMFAVKIGNSSSKLCYAVDQSLTSIKLYKKGLLTFNHKIDTVGLWLVLENHKHIEDSNGKPKVNSLNLIMLKNRIDQWKKEVRLQGFKPIIYINYRDTK